MATYKQKSTLISAALPGWIRWTNLYFLLAILIPVILLLVVKSPVYEEKEFSGYIENGRLTITSSLQDSLFRRLRPGEKVFIKPGAPLSLRYNAVRVHWLGGRIFEANLVASGKTFISGEIFIQSGSVNITKMIFTL